MEKIGLDIRTKKSLLAYLMEFVSDHKKCLFEEIIEHRTEHLTVVLEDIYQPQNASAVLRSCDCFGIQNVHIIENTNQYRISSGVTLGADKWLTKHYYNKEKNNTLACINSLKKQGYQIVATTPHEQDCSIEDLDLSQKTALIFGNEHKGISDIAIKHADNFAKIPMYGFSESLNISVSAAICLFHLSQKMKMELESWGLEERTRVDVLLNWARSTVKKVDLIERDFMEKSVSNQ